MQNLSQVFNFVGFIGQLAGQIQHDSVAVQCLFLTSKINEFQRYLNVNKRQLIFFVISLVLLQSCASLSEEQCKQGNWAGRLEEATGGRIKITFYHAESLVKMPDLFDATDVASCRMYAGAREVLAGLMKNAHEALASPIMIVPMTLMLAVGQVLPWILLAGWVVLSPRAWAIAVPTSLGTTRNARRAASFRTIDGWRMLSISLRPMRA